MPKSRGFKVPHKKTRSSEFKVMEQLAAIDGRCIWSLVGDSHPTDIPRWKVAKHVSKLAVK